MAEEVEQYLTAELYQWEAAHLGRAPEGAALALVRVARRLRWPTLRYALFAIDATIAAGGDPGALAVIADDAEDAGDRAVVLSDPVGEASASFERHIAHALMRACEANASAPTIIAGRLRRAWLRLFELGALAQHVRADDTAALLAVAIRSAIAAVSAEEA